MSRGGDTEQTGGGHIWRGPGQTRHDRTLPGAGPELLVEDRPVTRTWLLYGRLPKRGESYLCLTPWFSVFYTQPSSLPVNRTAGLVVQPSAHSSASPSISQAGGTGARRGL